MWLFHYSQLNFNGTLQVRTRHRKHENRAESNEITTFSLVARSTQSTPETSKCGYFITLSLIFVVPQGRQNGPKSELERDRGLELKVGLELLRDARRALELQAKDPKVARHLKFELESDPRELEVELVLKLEFEPEREVKLELKL